MPYIHFTEQQKQQARQTDLCELLRSQGEQLKRSGSEFEWRNGSEKVTIRGNLWFHQYERVGGDAIDFVRRYYNKSYPEAMEYLLGGANGTLVMAQTVPRKKSDEPFELPPRNDNMRRVYAYLLTKRGIDKEVLDTFVRHGLIYESAKYHNAVFVGKDNNGKACHASLRGTGYQSSYRGNEPNSIPEYSFHWNGTSDRLYLFEAPIDMLSYISMHKANWQSHSYAAACGVSDRVLFQMLEDVPNIRKVYLCLDNDAAGRAATDKISLKLYAKGTETEVLVPSRKDWNEVLLSQQTNVNSEVNEKCQALRL